MMGNNETKTPTTKDVYYLKIRTKSDNQPHFEVKFHAGEKDYQEKPNVSFVEGYIKSIEPGGYEWEGEKIKTYTIVMVDKNDMYIISTSYTMVSRSILNMLSSADYPGRIQISLYYKQSGYPAAYLENNGEALKWKHSYEEMQAHVESFKGPKGKRMNDYTKLDDFFESEIPDLNAKFEEAYETFGEDEIGVEGGDGQLQEEEAAPVMEAPAPKTKPRKVMATPTPANPDDELPF